MIQYKCAECGALLKQGYACTCGSDMAEPAEHREDMEAPNTNPAPATSGP